MHDRRRITGIEARAILALAVIGAVAVGCGGSEPEPQAATDVIVTPPAPPAPPLPATPPPAPPPPPITVTPGENGPLPEGPTAKVRILSPTRDQVVRAGPVKVRLQVRNWHTEPEGPHVHVVVDDQPYRRIDDPAQTIELTDLAEGEHWLRVFPSRATHESVKTPGAFAWVRFFVGSRPADAPALPRGPMPILTYSRPKGAMEGDAANHVLFDFYLADVTLAPDGAKVHYWIDGANEGDITAWVPHSIDNLPDGPHRITLELRDPHGQPIPGRFNRTEHEISVSRAGAQPQHTTH
ncbi:MAG: hypothetical protein HYY06_32310 [Deltaproteobacteria bacterium]|nr:hypothetical protein [Deltaproteobacteria bacterium]